MRFILSVLAAIAGAVMLIMGLLQFSAASQVTSITASGESTSQAPLLVLEDEVLASHAGAQSIVVKGDSKITVAIGRSPDVHGWVGDAKHDVIRLDEVPGTEREQEPLKFVTSGSEETVPSIADSDLWTEVSEGEGELKIDTVVAPGYSMLIASDGENPAPANVAITWPFGGYAPMSGPLIVAGSVMLLVALLLLLWALAARRRQRRAAELAPAPVPSVETDAVEAEQDTVVGTEEAADAAATVDAEDTEVAAWSTVNWDPDEPVNEAERDELIGAELEEVDELDVSTPFTPEHADEEPLHTSEIPVVDVQQLETEPETRAVGEIVAAEPEVDDSVFAKPADAEPVAAEPVSDEPVAAEPAAAEPAIAEPAADEIETGEESADNEPATGQPAVAAHEAAPASPPEPAAAPAEDENKWKRPRGRNRSNAPKRVFLVAPLFVVGSLTLAGCAPQYWPAQWTGADVSPTGTPTSTAEAAILDEGAALPALTTERADEIIDDAMQLAQTADKERDAEKLKPRFTGDAFAEREAIYKTQKADGEIPGPVPFPTGNVAYLIPVASAEWPRTVFAVVDATSDGSVDAVPFGAMLVQETARDPYKIESLVQLAPGISLPEAAPVEIGAESLETVTDSLVMAPDQVAAAYADIIAKGDKAEHADKFSAENDILREQVNEAYRKNERDGLDAEVAKMDFAYAATETAPVGVTTLDGGAIIAVSIKEKEKLSAVSDRSRIAVSGRTAALSGMTETQLGFERVYTDQLLFYVPFAESGEKIRFLGTSQSMTSARQLGEDEVELDG